MSIMNGCIYRARRWPYGLNHSPKLAITIKYSGSSNARLTTSMCIRGLIP
jgi:hypothetical protein